MTMVYLLISRNIYSESERILGAFSSQKNADEAKARLTEVDFYYKKFPDRLYTKAFEVI